MKKYELTDKTKTANGGCRMGKTSEFDALVLGVVRTLAAKKRSATSVRVAADSSIPANATTARCLASLRRLAAQGKVKYATTSYNSIHFVLAEQ